MYFWVLCKIGAFWPSYEEAFKYFPNAHSIINGLIDLLPKRKEVLKKLLKEVETNYQETPSDIPSSSFKGPF